MNNTRRFDRHAHMSKDTREAIIDCQKELYEFIIGVDCWELKNYLSGLFDGYDYTDIIPEMEEMKAVKEKRPEIHQKILDICKEVSQYPDGTTRI